MIMNEREAKRMKIEVQRGSHLTSELIRIKSASFWTRLVWLIRGAMIHNAQDDAVSEANPAHPLVETCHTHGEYTGPICPECESPLDFPIVGNENNNTSDDRKKGE